MESSSYSTALQLWFPPSMVSSRRSPRPSVDDTLREFEEAELSVAFGKRSSTDEFRACARSAAANLIAIAL